MKFSLYPFSESDALPAIIVSGTIARQNGILSLYYNISGPMDRLKIPAPVTPPARSDRLWEATCFELFFRARGTDAYWEVNLSPSGNWNVYRFDDYRKGMAEEIAFSVLPFYVTPKKHSFEMVVQIPTDTVLPSNPPLMVGISAVIQTISGNRSYQAMTHPGPEPDFHLIEAFCIEL